MTYTIVIDPQARDQIRAFPVGMPEALVDVITMLELTPWIGAPYVATKPDGNIRQLAFGPDGMAMVVYLILEGQRRVDILKVLWLA